MRRLFWLILLAEIWALDWVHPVPTAQIVLWAGVIQQKNILLTDRQIYLKAGAYYRPVYRLPEAVKAAELRGGVLATDKYAITFTPAVNLTASRNTELRPAPPPAGVFWLRERLTDIYVQEDLDGDRIKEVIFRWSGAYYLAELNSGVVKEAKPVALHFSVLDNMPHFTFVYKGRKYAYEKKGLRWNRDAAQIFAPEELAGKNVEELELLRALIEARKGKIFRSPKIQAYLREQSWYAPDPQYTPERLTQKELRNLEIIFTAENAKLREGLYEYKTPKP
ncbi:MAG: YARHG domain-containing protein [Candidatus Margulisbacteria bacterium]|jgi:hypothetical protein|nr:YARHG domain-containing protein [Candidatus Margulisiibacteriota bacterium]